MSYESSWRSPNKSHPNLPSRCLFRRRDHSDMGLPCQFRPDQSPMFTTQFILTGLVLVAALSALVWMIILEKRPRTDLNPRLMPTTTILLVSGFIALLAFIHLVNLAGLHTGRFR
jgi:hypothetical protein